ncbi:MAG: DUF4450 domain-containing protein [Verrucomicrobia bacterium]|nr:DUF4450 domain-containing protein [Verrucomicrobiota bacterium]
MSRKLKLPFVVLLLPWALIAYAQTPAASELNCYRPTEGGWEISLSGTGYSRGPTPGSRIGMVDGNARLHRRPLFPPADKTMIWSPDELRKLERYGFRPLVLAYNEPRFLFDFHSAGGLLGHLQIGLSTTGASKWFHQWSDLHVRYVDGRMEYTIHDASFPGLTVSLLALPLADSAGLIVKVRVDGLEGPAALVWAYGGASAFSTGYSMDAPEFRFEPHHCEKNVIAWDERGFALRRAFDKSDVYMNEVFAAARYLTNWQAVIRGGSSWTGDNGFGAPEAVTNSPAVLIQNTEWQSATLPGEKGRCVAVQKVLLAAAQPHEGFIVVGLGGGIADDLRAPTNAWRAAQARNHSIANRIVTRTPDPHLDAAVRMMAFATEGTWGDSAILHGGWSWRFAYLGWRGWYGSTAYGWTDRVKKSILNHTRLGLVRNGPDAGGLGSLLEYNPGIYYNMNEVFLDQVRQYFDYTNDLNLMREIFPILVGIVDWENRRLQPKQEYLYENSLNTWISDSHWYIQGQCTQASAYMLRAHNLLADLARRLGKDATSFEQRAQHIRAAMQEKLWLPRAGVFAEYLDTRGSRLLHAEPELATIYHAAEFGAADPLQIYQMLHWVDTHLRSETTPNAGKLVWSSNWFPNHGRSYTHSTYEMAYGEELNLALTDYLAGRADDAYAIVRATLCGIYNGPTPGGLSCHADADGRQRANDEFADAISMWGRTITEGLFGIVPKRPDGFVGLTPQFPNEWNDAAIDTPHFSYRWQRKEGKISIEWNSPMTTSVHLHLPLQAQKVRAVWVNGTKVASKIVPGFDGLSWLQVETVGSQSGTIEVRFEPRIIRPPAEFAMKQGERLSAKLPGLWITDWNDPQSILKETRLEKGALQGVVSGEPGHGLVLVLVGDPPCRTWIPIKLLVEPKTNPPPPKMWSVPQVTKGDLAAWTLVDLATTFNDSVTNVLPRVTQKAQPPPSSVSQVGFGYWKDHLLQYHGSRNSQISDAAWRKKVGADGVAWTTDGIPFKTAKDGANIGVVTLAGGFPTQLDFPVNARGKTLYLMISGMTFPAQSHVVNLRVTLHHANGKTEPVDLVNPFGIGDCWSTWCGRFHDTAANGFENIGGRSGPAGSTDAGDLTKPIALDTEAHLIALDLNPEVELRRVSLEAIANDCVFGLMGATVLK